MKLSLALLLVIASFALAGCGDKTEPAKPDPAKAAAPAQDAKPAAAPTAASTAAATTGGGW